MSTQEVASQLVRENEEDTELVMLRLAKDGDQTLPRVLQLGPASSAMIRAMLNTTIEQHDGEVTEDIDPISNISTSNLITIGGDREIRGLIDSLIDLKEESDRELIKQVLDALSHGKKAQEVVRGLISVLCAYVMEPPEEFSNDNGNAPAYSFLSDNSAVHSESARL